jgi:CHASE2 domain-containing sensor protein
MLKATVRCFSVTAFVFLVMWGVQKITTIQLFQAFDPISKALTEFELTDIVFSKLRPDPVPDSRIVLVNIGPDRRSVAFQIQTINQYKPKVIGVDGFFNCEGGFYDTVNCPQLKDTLGNLMLANAIQEAGNVVLVSRLLKSDSLARANVGDFFDSLEYSDPIFRDHAHNAFANLVTGATYQEDVKICKSFVPRITVKNDEQLAFSVQMAMMYDSVKTRKFLQRGNYEEIINFRGNFEVPDVKIEALRNQMSNSTDFRSICFAIDWEPFARGEYLPGMFENSIVIIGSLGDYFGDPAWEDKFFTPLNLKVAGRANPDMFGVVVHANIVSMILNEDYIDQLDDWLLYLIAFIICFLNVILFSWIDNRWPVLFDGFSVVIQLVEIVLVGVLIVQVFASYSIKLDLTVSIAALALIGPCFDIYKSLEKTLFNRVYNMYSSGINALKALFS